MNKFLIVAAVSLTSAAAGFFAYKNIHYGAAGTAVAATTPAAPATTKMTSPPEAATPAPKAKGIATTLPEFSLENRAGQKQSIRSWPGKSMVINFWATWCAPCRKEIPLLNELSKSEAKAGFQVVGIAIDFRDEVLKYADKIGISYPLLMGEQDGLAAADAFGVASAGLPFTVFTDNKGRVVTLFVGEITKPKAKILIDGVSKVNRGELTPEAARAAIASQIQALSG